MSLRPRDQRIPLSIQFEQAAILGRSQARQSSQGSRWEGRLRVHTTASPAVRSRAIGNRQASKGEKDRSGRGVGSQGKVNVAPRRKAAQKLANERPTRKSGRGTTAKAQAEKQQPVVHTAERRHGWKTGRTRQASKERSVEVELEAELPAMADEELGAYAEVENAEVDAPTGDVAQENGRRRRMSNKAERYGQKPETSPKTPNGSKGGQRGDKAAANGDRREGAAEGPRGSVEHAAMVVSPGTAVKRSPGERGHEGTAPGVTSPGSLKALKATFEMGVRAELEARRAETERAIEADREKMKTHEVALRKRVREREEAEADRDQAVSEGEEYVATKQRAAEELERRAKRARTEAEEAEKETEAARQRATEEYARRVAGLDVEEEQRAIEALQSAIAAREKALREGERKEAEAVGALVNEQLTELQQKVDKIWGQQVAGARDGA